MNSYRSLIYSILLYLGILCTVCFAIGQPAATASPVPGTPIARFSAAEAGSWKPHYDTLPPPKAMQLNLLSSRHTSLEPETCSLGSGAVRMPEAQPEAPRPAEWSRP